MSKPKRTIDVELPRGTAPTAVAIAKGGYLVTKSWSDMTGGDYFLRAERDVTAQELSDFVQKAQDEDTFAQEALAIGLVLVEAHLLYWAGPKEVRFH